jgi:hypothetical protein
VITKAGLGAVAKRQIFIGGRNPVPRTVAPPQNDVLLAAIDFRLIEKLRSTKTFKSL